MIGIILAAGRGARMKNKTKNIPKCLVKILGKSLLNWQISSFKKNKIEKLYIVTGYKQEKIKKILPNTIYNAKWSQTNMVYSLYNAKKILEKKTCIISYSDIVYHPDILNNLINTKSDITITYDLFWNKLWEIRFKNPLEDAETFIIKNDKLIEIGKKTTNINLIQGQFIGLLKITPKGWNIITDTLKELPKEKFESIDVTALLNIILKKTTISIVPTKGKWLEVDSDKDLLIYEKILQKQKKWSHDWK